MEETVIWIFLLVNSMIDIILREAIPARNAIRYVLVSWVDPSVASILDSSYSTRTDSVSLAFSAEKKVVSENISIRDIATIARKKSVCGLCIIVITKVNIIRALVFYLK